MYRENVPRHALFLGDVLVVPEVSLSDRDPRVVTFEARKFVCGACGKKVKEPRLNCDNPQCGSQFPKEKGQVVITSVGDRQKEFKKAEAEGKQPDDPLAPKGTGKVQVLATFKPVAAMVISRCCNIDRQGDIRLLGVRPMSDLSHEQRTALRTGEGASFFFPLPPFGPLPGCPRALPECVVDLNASFSIPYWYLGVQTKYPSRTKGSEEDALVPFKETIEQRLAALDDDGLEKFFDAKSLNEHGVTFEYPADIRVEPLDVDRLAPDPWPERGWSIPFPKWIEGAPRAAVAAGT